MINPNLLETDVDLAVMREGVKTARAFVAAPAWSDYIIAEFGDFAKAQTDEELDEFIRATGDSVYHPVGTAAMGAALEADLRVKGTRGFRVVDASAFVSIAVSGSGAQSVSRSLHLMIDSHSSRRAIPKARPTSSLSALLRLCARAYAMLGDQEGLPLNYMILSWNIPFISCVNGYFTKPTDKALKSCLSFTVL